MPGKLPQGMMEVGIYSGDINVVSMNGGIAPRRILVTETAQQIVTSLPYRKMLRIINLGDNDVYVGADSSVSSGDGWPVFAQTWQGFNFGPGIQPYIVQVSGTGDCRLMDLG